MHQTFLKKIFSFQKKYFLLSALTFSLILITQQSCNTTGPTPTRDVELSVSDVSCTEAWLNLTVNNLTSNTKVQLVRNDNVVNTFDITTHDTTLYDDSLSPNKTYNYQVIELQNETAAAKSDVVYAKTMDTTSNNFTWQKYYFGADNAGSSHLSDVAIVSDTNIWCVGAIYLDSADGTPDPNAYNAVHWDGKSWQPLKIMFPLCNSSGNQLGSGSYQAEGIFSFSANDIWFSCAVSLVHWNGKVFKQICMPLGYGERDLGNMWGSNGQLYLVGTNGFLAHYQNGTWQKIESGTTLDIQDIWGITNSNKTEIYCIASNLFTGDGNAIFQIIGNQVNEVSKGGLPLYYFSSIWFKNTQKVYIAGNGIYKNNNLDDNGYWNVVTPQPTQYYTYSIRGNDINDIVVVGVYGEVLHYNGVNWTSYKIETGLSNGDYLSVAIKGDKIIAVGYNGAKAVITMARRQ